MKTRAWKDGALTARDFPVEQVSAQISGGAIVWVDMCQHHPEDLKTLATELRLDPLSVEDAVSQHERAKIELRPGHMFLTVYSTKVADGSLTSEQVSAFVTEGAFVTVRSGSEFDVKELRDRWSDAMTTNGTIYLLHGFLDLIVDQHFVSIQALDDELDTVEDALFSDKSDDPAVQRRTFTLRRSLVLLSHVVLPMREIVNTLLRRDLKIVPEALTPYFQDIYDHTLRATEWTGSLRELVSNVMETRIALHGNQMNEAMKKVTGWAAMIAIPTAVTGFYGMNVPYPGTGKSWGFWFCMSVLLVATIALYTTFKRRNWL
ncbi:magnesium transporter CorA family protein [Actinocorallia lasiicapitis]